MGDVRMGWDRMAGVRMGGIAWPAGLWRYGKFSSRWSKRASWRTREPLIEDYDVWLALWRFLKPQVYGLINY